MQNNLYSTSRMDVTIVVHLCMYANVSTASVVLMHIFSGDLKTRHIFEPYMQLYAVMSCQFSKWDKV